MQNIWYKNFVSTFWLQDYETQANFLKFDDGNVCNNCAWKDWECNDKKNIKSFNLMKNYLDALVGIDVDESSQFKATHIKYKESGLRFMGSKSNRLEDYLLNKKRVSLILHLFLMRIEVKIKKYKRLTPGAKAIEELRNEGHKIKYIFIKDKHLKDMKYYQVQADIVVEQLIYGWWGSTGVETMSLGKPVICYLRESWIKNFHNYYPEIKSIPIVKANVLTLRMFFGS